jgi:DNA invertase Pin-like site-specific DNA recombinase
MATKRISHDTRDCSCPKCRAIRLRDRPPALVGYARVSTTDQNSGLQTTALESAGCARIFADDGVSGSVATRPALDDCLAYMQAGDTLVIWKLDRLGRSLKHLLEVSEALKERGIALRSLTEGFDTSTSAGKMLYAILGAVAQFERDVLKERTNAGLQQARRNGKVLGPKRKLSDEQVRHAIDLAGSDKNPSTIASILGVDRTTVWRAIRRVTAIHSVP